MSQIAAALVSAILTFLAGLGFFFAVDKFSKLQNQRVMGTIALAPNSDMTGIIVDTPVRPIAMGTYTLRRN
jgi:hypothetical protein